MRAPVAQVVVGDNPVAQQTERAGQTIPQDGGADVADVHGFGHVGRAEIHHHGPRMRGGFAEKVFPARGTLKGLGQRGRFEAEVQETRAGDLHRGASIGDIQFGDHVRGQLARIQFPGLGERHQCIGLVIAKLGVRAWADQNSGNISVRQYSSHCLLEALFDEFVGEHRLKKLNGFHGYIVKWLRASERGIQGNHATLQRGNQPIFAPGSVRFGAWRRRWELARGPGGIL